MATEASLYEDRSNVESSQPLHASKGQDQISLLDVLIVLGEKKRVIFLVTCLTTLLAILAAFILPQQYKAVSVVIPPQQGSSIGSAIASQLSNMGGLASFAGSGLGIKNANDMIVAMMKSRTVEDGMVQRFGLMGEYKCRYLSDARKALERHTTIESNTKDGLIRISITDKDPNRAAELTNGYVDQFRNLSEHLAITEASQRRLFFEKQLEAAKNNLADAEEALKRTQQQTGVIQPEGQARALIESAASLRAQISAKEVQIRSIMTFATDQNAELVKAQQELAALQAQLTKLGGSENDAEGESIIVPRGKVPEAELEYVRKLRDVKYYETIFEILARQFEFAKLDEAKEGALVQVVDLAVPPDKKSFPQRGLVILLGIVAGFVIGAFCALALAGFERMRKDSETNDRLERLRYLFSFRRHQPSA